MLIFIVCVLYLFLYIVYTFMQTPEHMLLLYLQFAILLTNKINQNFLSKQTTGPSSGLFSWKILDKEIPALFVTILFDKCGV